MYCVSARTLVKCVPNLRDRRLISTLADDLRSKFSKFKGGSVVLTKDEGSGVARIRIDNPSKRNSMSGEMMVQLHDAVTELQDWKNGKAVILHGTDGFFCSGADLDMVKDINTPEQGAQMATIMHAALTGLHELPLISVAVVEGRALGGGAEMITACDFRLMVQGAEVQFVHVRMGLVPGWGGTTRLVHLLGPKMALHILTSGCKITGERAVAMGFAEDIVHNTDNPLLEAERWLHQYTSGNDPEIIQAESSMDHIMDLCTSQHPMTTMTKVVSIPLVAKRTIVRASNLLPADSAREELKLFASVWSGPANREALKKNIRH